MIRRIVSLLSSATEILFAALWRSGRGGQSRVRLAQRGREIAPGGLWGESRRPPPAAALTSKFELSAAGAAVWTRCRSARPAWPELIVTQTQCGVLAARYADVVAAVASDPRLKDNRRSPRNPLGLVEVFEEHPPSGRSSRGSGSGRSMHCLSRIADRNDSTSDSGAFRGGERPRVVCIEWTEPLMLAVNRVPELSRSRGGKNGLSDRRAAERGS